MALAIKKESLILSKQKQQLQKIQVIAVEFLLFLITLVSSLAVLFIFYFIAKDALPFFFAQGIFEFFTSSSWYPSADNPEFGCLSLFVGSGLVTLGATFVAVPLGISAAVCLSDVLPFKFRQAVKPVTEILAAIPSVAYGFFALVVFAPLLQNNGNRFLAYTSLFVLIPVFIIIIIVITDLILEKLPQQKGPIRRIAIYTGLGICFAFLLYRIFFFLMSLSIDSGANALNVSIILGIMALPTIISVSEDALQACGRELREGSYALGATRAETIIKTVIPAAASGILAAVILGIMRAVGETMVVWMASGNAAQIPEPWYNYLQPVRTLTATIAGDMGEADQVTGSARYHVLFAMALCLLLISFGSNLLSEYIVYRQQKKLGLLK